MKLGQNLNSMSVPVTRGRRSSVHQVRAGCLAPGATGQEVCLLSLLGLHFTLGFPPGQTEDAKPISEPEKETRELGKLGIWTLLSLGQGCQTHFHWGPHQPVSCIQRAEYNFRTV